MRICTCAIAREKLHSITQPLEVTSTLLAYCSSTMRRSTPRMTTELHHFSEHQHVESTNFCGYCWTTRRMNISVTTRERLRCTMRRIMVALKLCSYYWIGMQRSMPGTMTDINLFSVHITRSLGLKSLRSGSYCWTTMQMCMFAATRARLYSTTLSPKVISRLLG
jgi:hypothetical protein